MARKKRKIEIVELKTNKVERTIITYKQGSMYNRLIDGLHRKVDLERFYIREVEV